MTSTIAPHGPALSWAPLVTLLLILPSCVDLPSKSTGTSASAGTMSGTGSETDSEGTESTASTATTDGTVSTGAETSTSGSTTAATAGLECDPQDLPECEVEACVQSWDYGCPDCEIEFDRARCFEVDLGCAYPALECDLAEPCERVWAFGSQDLETLDTFESEAAAICVLESLRDGSAAHHELLWGAMETGSTRFDVFVDGAGGATLQWTVDCPGCPISGHYGRSGLLTLNSDDFFETCLKEPTTQSLLECVYGLTMVQEADGPPEGYTPPWTTGECSQLVFACPS